MSFVAFTQKNVQYLLLVGIIVTAIALRWVSADFEVLLGTDPWWFYRHAQEIYNNHFEPPEWDILSYYPPGRPVDYYLGWSYTLAIFYAITQPFFPDLTLMKFSGLFVPIFASITAIPAYFVGRMITNRWGGLITALFAVISPKFLVLSLAGYPDSDSAVVFYTFVVVLATLYAVKKADKLDFENFEIFCESLIKYLPYLIPALLAYWLFSMNWNFSWYIYFIFLFFIPILILFRLLQRLIFHHERGFGLLYQKIRESRNIIVPVALIGLFGEFISYFTYRWPYFTIPPHQQLIEGLNILKASTLELTFVTILFVSLGVIAGLSVSRIKGLLIGGTVGFIIPVLLISMGISGETLIVNQGIAELQPLNLFSSSGFTQIVGRIGSAPFIVGVVGILGITLFKLITKREVTTPEYFGLFWIIISLFLASFGDRFSLLLTMAVATTAGFVLGNLIELLKSRKIGVAIALYGLIIFGIAIQVNDDLTNVYLVAKSFEVSKEWIDALTWLKENADRDALIVTWTDAGHIITGFTSLRVHSDGAHCAGSCIPYNHDIRIVDIGRIFSTGDENESVGLLRKYVTLSPMDCRKVSDNFGRIVPDDTCKSPAEVFVIASRDMVAKYFWISYFGSYDYETRSGKGTDYELFLFTKEDSNGSLLYNDGAIEIKHRNDQPIAVIDLPERGIRNQVVSQMVFFDVQGKEKRLEFSDSPSNTVSGLLWVSPDWKYVIFMDHKIKDSILTKLFFFNGRGLQHFELVFRTPEVKIYKLIL